MTKNKPVFNGKQLREVRQARGKTQAELGTIFGVSNVTVSQWETGRLQPSLHQQNQAEAWMQKGVTLPAPKPSPSPGVPPKLPIAEAPAAETEIGGGAAVKAMRVAAGLTPAQGANLIGVSKGHLSNLENGHAPVSQKVWQRVLKAFKTPAPLSTVAEKKQLLENEPLSQQLRGAASRLADAISKTTTAEGIRNISEAVLNLTIASVRAKEIE